MNKLVLVTGAHDGTGLAIAERFAREGWDVAVTSRKVERASEAAEYLAGKYGVNAFGYALESPVEQQVIDTFNDIRAKGYLIDTVVLNAADLGIGMELFSTTQDEYMRVVTTNMGWNFSISREAAKQMREKGGGSIVFINSNSAYRVTPNRSAYCSSKAGALGLMRTLALDLGKYNIKVNAVLPGLIKTVRWEANLNNCRESMTNWTPLGDVAEFEDVANAAYFLGSDQSRNTTGAELTVDGGNTIQLTPQKPENK